MHLAERLRLLPRNAELHSAVSQNCILQSDASAMQVPVLTRDDRPARSRGSTRSEGYGRLRKPTEGYGRS